MASGGGEDDDEPAAATAEASTSRGGMDDEAVVEAIETFAIVGVDADALARGTGDRANECAHARMNDPRRAVGGARANARRSIDRLND